MLGSRMSTAPILLVHHLPAGTGHSGAVRQMGFALAQKLGIEPARIIDNALAREESETTYLGRGLAMPHARVAGLTAPALCAAPVPAGLMWQGDEAQMILLLAVPEEQPELHLSLLSRLLRWYTGNLKTGTNPALLSDEELASALSSACAV